MIYITRDEIKRLNQRHLYDTDDPYRGTAVLLNPGSLDWVLEAIEHPVFDVMQYSTLSEKAAKLAWTVITAHVFVDGNKRTGMSALVIFLQRNGCGLNVTTDEIVETALLIAQTSTNGYTFDEFVAWVNEKIRPLT